MQRIKIWIIWLVVSAWSLITNLLGIKEQISMHKTEEHNELIVEGKGEVEIFLKDLPHHVEVMFKPTHEPPPCDHGHHHHHHHHHGHHEHDHLAWEVHKRHHGHTYVLEIEWRVEGIREIIWSVSY